MTTDETTTVTPDSRPWYRSKHRASLRLLPWKPRIRGVGNTDFGDVAWFMPDGGGDLAEIVVLVVVGIVLSVFGFLILPLLLFPLEIALLFLVVPAFYALRLCGVLPWVVVVRDNAGRVIRVEEHRWINRALARRNALRQEAR